MVEVVLTNLLLLAIGIVLALAGGFFSGREGSAQSDGPAAIHSD
jgi:hypothetical protein